MGDSTSINSWIETVAAVFTTFGVAIAAWQLVQSRRQAQAQFEDGLTSQYRRIFSQLPLDALLGRPLREHEWQEALRVFYEYFDFCNEQAFLAKEGRLRRQTWDNWREGIEQNLARQAFQKAWLEMAPDLNGSFDYFKELLPPHLKTITHR